MKVAIIGLYNSGSSALAQIVDALGFNLGPPFWHNYFESDSLRSHLVRWWSEPQLVEMVPQAERVGSLKKWLQEQMARNGRVCAKHPLLCLSAVDLPLAWGERGGTDVKYIRADRDLEESIRKLDARGWFKTATDPYPAARMQTTLWKSAEAFFSTHDHLRVDYNDMLADPRREIDRIVQYLEVPLTAAEFAKLAGLVRPK